MPDLPTRFDEVDEHKGNAGIIASLQPALPGNTVVSILRDRDQQLVGALLIQLEERAGSAPNSLSTNSP